LETIVSGLNHSDRSQTINAIAGEFRFHYLAHCPIGQHPSLLGKAIKMPTLSKILKKG
jgi:hypothetical protein